MSTLNPPAIVRGHEDEKAGVLSIKAAIKAGDDCQRGALKHYKRAGRDLWKWKKRVGHGHWIDWLQRNGIAERTASRYMRLAKVYPKSATPMADLDEEVKVLSEPCTPPDECDTGPETDSETPVASVSGPQSKLIPELIAWQFSPKILPRVEKLAEWQQEALLARLREGKHPFPALDEVEALRLEPGDDTPDLNPPKDPSKPKGGEVIVDWKSIDKSIGTLIRAVDRVGNAYKAKESPEAERLRAAAGEYRESFKAWVTSVQRKS